MDDFRNFLIEVLNIPELKDNRFAWTIAKYPNINMSTRETFYESLRAFYPTKNNEVLPDILQENESDELGDDEFKGKDFRIKKIQLSGIRCYPEENKPFGIDFCKNGNNQPSSAIILGSNGIGKSSIFDALEFMYCGRIGEYELRNDRASYSEDYSNEFKDYLTHLNSDNIQGYCNIETVNSNIDFPNVLFPKTVRKKLIPNSFFISEYDIYTIGKLDFEISNEKSIHYFIADSLGLKSYLDFIKNLNLFESYNRVKETRSLNALLKEIDTLNNSIKIWDEEIKKRSAARQEFISEKPNDANLDQEIDRQIELITLFLNKKIALTVENELKGSVDDFLRAYKELKGISISKDDEETIEFLEIGLSILPHSNNCPFCNDSNKTPYEIENNVRTRIDNVHIFSSKRKDLSKKYYDYTTLVTQYFENIAVIRQNIESENNSDFIKIPEALSLVNLNEDLIQNLNEHLSNWSLIQSSEKQFTLTNADSTFNNLSKNQVFFEELLPSFSKKIGIYLENREKILNNTLDVLKSKVGIPSNDYFKQIGVIEIEIQQFNFEKANANRRLIEAEKDRNNAALDLEIYQTIKKEASVYRNIIKSEIDKKIGSVFDPIKDIVEDLLNEFNTEDEFKITVGKGHVIDPETSEVISEFIKVFVLKDGIQYDIKHYLNTFRYKLFSLILSFAVAIANRKQGNLNINIPFVIDDIFYSSDFEKRLLVEGFIGKFFDLYSKYCPSLPIQLILFTHDELIFDCILSKLIKKDLIDKTIFGRLISYNESLELENYKELLYQIPDNIPQLIDRNIKELLTN